MRNNNCSKFKKVTGVVFIVLFFVQILSFLAINNIVGKLPEENGNLTPDNLIPIYDSDYFLVNNDVMYSGGSKYQDTHIIKIHNVSNPKNFQYYNSYEIYTYEGTVFTELLLYQLIDDKLFIIVQQKNDTEDSDTWNIGLEIVDVSDPTQPTMLCSYIFNDTCYAGMPFGNERYFRMFYRENLLYISLISDDNDIDYSIRVINCTDIYHPVEIARKTYEANQLHDFYLYDDVLYTLTTVLTEWRLTAYNYSDVTNITEIFEHDWSTKQPYEFIGEINGYLYTDAMSLEQQIYLINTTTYDLTEVATVDLSDDYKQSKIFGDNLFTITSEAFNIYDVSSISSYTILSTYEPKADIFSFQKLVIDGTRAYISCIASEEALLFFILDISDLTSPTLLLPNSNVLPLPIFCVIIAISLIYLIGFFKKRRAH